MYTIFHHIIPLLVLLYEISKRSRNTKQIKKSMLFVVRTNFGTALPIGNNWRLTAYVWTETNTLKWLIDTRWSVGGDNYVYVQKLHEEQASNEIMVTTDLCMIPLHLPGYSGWNNLDRKFCYTRHHHNSWSSVLDIQGWYLNKIWIGRHLILAATQVIGKTFAVYLKQSA